MSLISIDTKIVGSSDYNKRKVLASDINQLKGALQIGTYDIKPNDINMEGNVITADSGQDWIRRYGNTFQFYNGSSWQEPSTATLLTFTAGENIAARDVVYIKVSDGKIYKASTANNDWIGVATSAITSGASGTIYPNGSLVGGFTGLTRGSWYGLNATAGTLTANENYIVGLAISATQIILVKPKGDMSTKDNALYKLQGEKAINDVSATNSGILAGSSQVLIDKFLDANGQNNTVDTGNTTAFYNSFNRGYEGNATTGVQGSEISQPNAYPLSTIDDSETLKTGFKILCNKKSYISSIIKQSGCTATKTYIYDASLTLLATISFSGDVATLSTPLELSQGNTYYVLAGVDSGTYTKRYTNVSSYPTNNEYLSYIGGYILTAGDSNRASNIRDIKIKQGTYTDGVVQSAVATVPTGMTKVLVTPLMYESLATGDSITADVSIDNGAHYTTGVPINTWTPITSDNGTQLIVKANLLTGTGATTPKVSGWRVLLE